MAQQNINFGTFPDDPTADSIRTSFQKIQQNFTDLYSGAVVTGVSKVSAGDGVTINRSTGNVVVASKIASVAFESPPDTLLFGTNGLSNDETVVVYNSGSNTQTTNPIKITLSPNLKLTNVSMSGTTNIGSVKNLKITGGSPGYVLHKSITAGSGPGDLEWRPLSQYLPSAEIAPYGPEYNNDIYHLTGVTPTTPTKMVITDPGPYTPATQGRAALQIYMQPSTGTIFANLDSVSDRNQKTNIEPITHALEKVNALNGVTFTYLHSNKPAAGLIAQDVQAVLPQTTSKEADGILRMNYNGVIGLLVESVKTLAAEINTLKQQLADIQQK